MEYVEGLFVAIVCVAICYVVFTQVKKRRSGPRGTGGRKGDDKKLP